jgi:hypothetical protein
MRRYDCILMGDKSADIDLMCAHVFDKHYAYENVFIHNHTELVVQEYNSLQHPSKKPFADIVVIVFNPINSITYNHVDKWIETAQRCFHPLKAMALVAHDVCTVWNVSPDRSRKYAEQKGMLYFETSTREQTKKIFQHIIDHLVKLDRKSFPQQEEMYISSETTTCCKCM